MKSHTEYLWFNTKQKTEFINITAQIEEIVEKAKIKEGFCLVSQQQEYGLMMQNQGFCRT